MKHYIITVDEKFHKHLIVKDYNELKKDCAVIYLAQGQCTAWTTCGKKVLEYKRQSKYNKLSNKEDKIKNMSDEKFESFDYLIKEVSDDCLLIQTDDARFANSIKRVIQEVNGKVVKENYISKINDYVSYDYEPFPVAGFKYEAHAVVNKLMIKYAAFLLEQKLNKIISLEKLLEASAA